MGSSETTLELSEQRRAKSVIRVVLLVYLGLAILLIGTLLWSIDHIHIGPL
jgi:hypothetical protein